MTRSTDFGSHIMVDVELRDGSRLKAMTAPDARWRKGDTVRLSASDFALYRQNRLLARGRLQDEASNEPALYAPA